MSLSSHNQKHRTANVIIKAPIHLPEGRLNPEGRVFRLRRSSFPSPFCHTNSLRQRKGTEAAFFRHRENSSPTRQHYALVFSMGRYKCKAHCILVAPGLESWCSPTWTNSIWVLDILPQHPSQCICADMPSSGFSLERPSGNGSMCIRKMYMLYNSTSQLCWTIRSKKYHIKTPGDICRSTRQEIRTCSHPAL